MRVTPKVAKAVENFKSRVMTGTLTPSTANQLKRLAKGDPAPLLKRFEELQAKKSLTPSELKEMSGLGEALGDLGLLKGKSEFVDGKKKPMDLDGGLIDKVQSVLDGATTAAGVGSMAAGATGVGVVPGAVLNVISNVGDLLNAGVDLAQAGVAAAKGDYVEAGKQLKDAGSRAIGAIPVVGDLKQAAKAAKAAKGLVEVAGAGAKAANAADLASAAAKAADAASAAAKASAKLPLREAMLKQVKIPIPMPGSGIGVQNARGVLGHIEKGSTLSLRDIVNGDLKWGRMLESLGAFKLPEGSFLDAGKVLRSLDDMKTLKTPAEKINVLQRALEMLENANPKSQLQTANKDVVDGLKSGLREAIDLLSRAS